MGSVQKTRRTVCWRLNKSLTGLACTMNKASIIGMAMMGIGLLVWGVPALYLHYPIPVPLDSPLPLLPGASLNQAFKVRGSQNYFVFVKCREVGEFKELWKNYMNPKEPPTIPCDIGLHVLRNGREIHSEHLRSLTPGMTSAGVDYWMLTGLRLPSSNMYELRLTNGTDLTYLQPTEPTVQIELSPAFFKNGMINASIGFLAGAMLFLIGLTKFIIGSLSGRRRANPTASLDGKATTP